MGEVLATGYNWRSLSHPPESPDTVIINLLKSANIEGSSNEVLPLPWPVSLSSLTIRNKYLVPNRETVILFASVYYSKKLGLGCY